MNVLSLRNFLAVVRFGVRKQWHLICIFAVIALIAVSFESIRQWHVTWSAISGIAALGVSIMVWYGERREEFLKSLPKRLDVDFWLQGKPLMVCRNASLVSEGDIRNWAQQIGYQMNQKNNLFLELEFDSRGPVEDLSQPQPVVRYSIRMYLSGPPQELLETMPEDKRTGYVYQLQTSIEGREIRCIPFEEFQDHRWPLTEESKS